MAHNQGGRCKCEGCGETFSGLSVFDMHRVGTYKQRGHTRRCLSADEMRARGMVRVDGRWESGRAFGATKSA